MLKSLKKINWKRGLINFALFYFGLMAVLFFIQRNLLYYPNGDYAPPATAGMEHTQELRLPAPDGGKSLAWFSPPPEDSSGHVVVFFHGNGDRLGYLHRLLTRLQEARLGFLAVEYRGYPGSAGELSEASLYNDGRAALDFLQAQGYREEHIILLGQSLGTGVAVQMATEYDVALVALISPFTAIADAAAEIYWYMPVQFLVLDKFDSYSKIRDVTAPLYVFHGTDDTLVPFALGQRLYNHATTQKRFFALDGQGHNTVDMASIIREIALFTQSDHVTEIPEPATKAPAP